MTTRFMGGASFATACFLATPMPVQAQEQADGLTVSGSMRLRYEMIDGQPRVGFSCSDDLATCGPTSLPSIAFARFASAWSSSIAGCGQMILARLSDDVLLVHGTPDSELEYFLETVTEDGLREATREEAEQRAGSANAAVILCGHTHVQRVMTLDDGRMIVNPGSVGLPAYEDDRPYPHLVESGSPHARYAVLSKEMGRWAAELLSVEYDWEQAARDAEVNGRLDWSRASRTGRV
ncbi:metallophosphoesterase family protein [Sphingomonas quercus]|uniref:metallophosphoesterase family protein n=1 Tax=Sphingomonas quercus TaxID=2842451 RepID=UPI00209AB1D0|nr:metallophosphoesterase family protein [Sphingomonas quercus]